MDIVKDAGVASGRDKPKAGQPSGELDHATSATPIGIKSSPPTVSTAGKTGPDAEDASPSSAKSDSEAETVVLPGSNGHSPSKTRKTIKLEDKFQEADRLDSMDIDEDNKNNENTEMPSEGATSNLGKRKRSKQSNANARHEGSRNGNSSGLSSVPTSPLATTRSSLSKRAESESDISKSPSPGASRRDQGKSAERDSLPDPDNEAPSADDKEQRRTRKRRSSGLDIVGQQNQQSALTSHAENNSRNPTRSTSPHLSAHRRSASSNSAVNGLSHKKRKLPAPLRATRDRQSIEEQSDDDSSPGESPQPRRSRTRNLATPPIGDSSVAKMPPHKKRNPFGRTALADACEDGDITKARRLLQEKPEDLDVADAAGNTPLQCASLNGHEDVVKLLLGAGCNIHCVNDRKDSPLLDAVENGHLEVVKLLLAAGVNPKVRNEEGEEPINKIDETGEDAEAIRQALMRARANFGPTQQSIPVQSPQTENYSSRSRRTQSHGRSTKTGEHQLYTSYNVSSLRSAAARGDLQTVGNILQVIVTPGFDDPESLVAAARGGHEEVLQILLGFGNADPDPPPLENKDWEHATPMLAAIGSDNIKVIELLLAKVDDDRFDPTKRYNGSTYYEIARQRMGPLWEEEERILKEAFDKYKSRSNSRPSATGQQGPSRGHQKKLSDSDARSNGAKSRPQGTAGISQGLKREQKGVTTPGLAPVKRGPGRPRKEGNEPPSTLDRERSSSATNKEKPQPKRSESDNIASQGDVEPSKPRRKLISGKEMKGEREKQRRASIASIPTSLNEMLEGDLSDQNQTKPSASNTAPPRLVNTPIEPDAAVEKSLDRARSIKRDDSKDRVTAIRGESPAKRPRQSSTPPSEAHDSGSLKPTEHGISNKRRRLDVETKNINRAEGRWSSSPDRRSTSGPSGLSNETPSAQKDPTRGSTQFQSTGSAGSPESQLNLQSKSQSQKASLIDDAGKQRLERNSKEKAHQDITDSHTHGEVTAASKVTQLTELPDLIQKIKEEERDAEEELEGQRLEDLRLEQEARQKFAREEAARRQQEKEELRRREQERREELRKAEEEKRRQHEEQLRLQREEQERRRAAQIAEQRAERRRIQLEQEAARLAKLPPLLRWFDGFPQPATPEFASEFRVMQGVRYDTIKPEATGSADAREQWLLNTQIALLLGVKELQLSRCKFIE